MPLLSVNGTELYYEDTGGDGEPVVFSHGLLWSCRLYDAQVAALRSRYRCIAFDHRGQGRSADVPGPSVPIETCYEDAVALVEALGVAPCHFVGLSMGGFVGMRIAARRPELLRSLTLLETSGEPEPAENVPRYRALNLVARFLGLSLVAGRVMPIMFGRTFLTDASREAEREEWRRKLTANRRSIWKAVNGVIERAGVMDELAKVDVPTLIAVGEEDVATVPAKSERLHQAIRGSRLERIPSAGHSSTVENPAAVNRLLLDFLDGLARSVRTA
jgi:3-oxoadipate enol-lactonase